MTRFTSGNKTEKKGGLKVEVTRKKKGAEEAQESVQSLGLCMTCIHLEGCGFRRDVSQAVIECDEFDIGQTPQPAAVEESEAAKPTEEFKGLCINCDVRHECKFPKPAEGVWHCEEYI